MGIRRITALLRGNPGQNESAASERELAVEQAANGLGHFAGLGRQSSPQLFAATSSLLSRPRVHSCETINERPAIAITHARTRRARSSGGEKFDAALRPPTRVGYGGAAHVGVAEAEPRKFNQSK